MVSNKYKTIMLNREIIRKVAESIVNGNFLPAPTVNMAEEDRLSRLRKQLSILKECKF